MKAVVCKAYGQPEELVIEEVPSPEMGPGEVKIRVHAAGVNFPDLLMVQGLYQRKPVFPFSPGLEVAGDVIETGQRVTQVKPGERVIAVVNDGGFAEEVVCPSELALKMPSKMPFEQGAVFPIVYGTSHVALEHRARLHPGETLLVLGAGGGVGLTAVEIGKLLGARVIAAASSAEKLALASEYGADEVINYVQDDLRQAVKDLTHGKGANVIYDPVGGDMFDAALRSIAWEGRLLVIGFASGRIPEMAVNLALLKNCSVMGTYWGAYLLHDPSVVLKSFMQLMMWYAEGKLKPYISARYPLEKAADALNALKDRKAKGKQVLLAK